MKRCGYQEWRVEGGGSIWGAVVAGSLLHHPDELDGVGVVLGCRGSW